MNGSNEVRRQLCQMAGKLCQHGLVAGPGGNISAREGGSMYISPSGYALDDITQEGWVEVDVQSGSVVSGMRPSSEVLMHLQLYRNRPDVNAIVHTHPVYCIGVISAGRDIPVMFADHAAILGDLPCLDYVLPTTVELANRVSQAIGSAAGVLLRNHGAITVGATLKEAYFRTEILEDAAKVFVIASLMGAPRVLSSAECAEVQTLESEEYRVSLLQRMKG
ncbi:MAG: class II aldolase/adducin family protein [Bacilli bacterium]